MNMDDYKTLIENKTLGMDDSFAFHCKGCGKCCKNRHDIILTTRDLYNAAQCLNMPVLDFVRTYCECYIGDASALPIIRLLPVGKTADCPMLNGKRCRIYAAKPVKCALYPLGRGELYGNLEDGTLFADGPKTIYFMNDTGCPTNRRTTVRNWLAKFGIAENDEFQKAWADVSMRLSMPLRQICEALPSKADDLPVWDMALHILYLSLDINQPFDTQFKGIKEEVDKLIALMERVLPLR